MAFPLYAPEGLEPVLEGLVGSFGDTFDWRTVGDGDKAMVGEAAAAVLPYRPPAADRRGRDRARRQAPGLHGRHRARVERRRVRRRRRPRAVRGDLHARRHPRADPPLGAPGRRVGARGERATADDHAFVADTRPGSLRRRGLRGVRRAVTLAAPHLSTHV